MTDLRDKMLLFRRDVHISVSVHHIPPSTEGSRR